LAKIAGNSSGIVHTTSVTLLERVRVRSDDRAWDRFVTLYTPFLLVCARRAGLHENDAADLVQDVFLHLLDELPKFQYDAGRKSFRGWLKTVTVNKCRERWRKRSLDTLLYPAAELAAVEDEAFWEQDYRDLLMQRALGVMQNEFETKTWRACWEFTVSGRKAADVAAELGMTEAAVFMAKSRVLKRLRQELSGLIE
jgi:RNA polymerase sigma-70 factor (ECF subfamily)